MTAEADSLLTPSILVVDDERQVHASIRLRLGDYYDLTSFTEPLAALDKIKEQRFDLCIVDLHMPEMEGLEFVEAAKQADPALGFVILTGHGSEENLRRAIPLQVYEFMLKPLPDKANFEQRLPDWIARTRTKRREIKLVEDSNTIAAELNSAQIERDVECTASESARDALLQSANLLTTIHAQLVTATHALEVRAKQDPSARGLLRGLNEARKAAEAATSVTEAFFNTAYANREDSPAVMGAAVNYALGVALRWTRAEEANKHVDLAIGESNAVVRDISAIDLLLLLIPALGIALEVTGEGTTVQVRVEGLGRLSSASRILGLRDFLWVNRRHAAQGEPAVLLLVRTTAAAAVQAELKSWLDGGQPLGIRIPSRGLLRGLAKCRGMLGLSVAPNHPHFELALVLPT